MGPISIEIIAIDPHTRVNEFGLRTSKEIFDHIYRTTKNRILSIAQTYYY
jgi:hypothetical protein